MVALAVPPSMPTPVRAARLPPLLDPACSDFNAAFIICRYGLVAH